MSYISDLTTEAQATVVDAVCNGVFTNEELVALVKELISTENVHSIEYSLEKMGLDLADLNVRMSYNNEYSLEESKDLMNKGLM